LTLNRKRGAWIGARIYFLSDHEGVANIYSCTPTGKGLKRHALVDGGVTTQPEFSFWFKDVGWKVENYGTDPDIEVDFRPQDYVANRDPQMERALTEIKRLLKKNPPLKPDFTKRPSLTLPKLPQR